MSLLDKSMTSFERGGKQSGGGKAGSGKKRRVEEMKKITEAEVVFEKKRKRETVLPLCKLFFSSHRLTFQSF
jgi:hypothetical protein